MLKKTKDDLINASKKLGSEKALEFSPIYLIPQKNNSTEILIYSLEKLMTELDKNAVLSEKNGTCIRLCADFGIGDIVNSIQPGFYDDSGNFKKTLEYWINEIGLRYHVNQGIVLIDLKQTKDLFSEKVWCEQLFRHIKRYKKHFLFFVSFDESDSKEVKNWIEKFFFCETIEVKTITEDDYIAFFKLQLEQYGIQTGDNCAAALKSLLSKYKSDINYTVLDIWLRKIVWDVLKSTDSTPILQNNDLSEDTLSEIIKNFKSDSSTVKIGFNL